MVSCGNLKPGNNNKESNFYNYSKKADLYRLPLIEPHELTSADRGYTWFYKHGNVDLVADSIGISNSFIVIYSASEYIPEKSGMFQQWYIINHIADSKTIVNSLAEYESFKKKHDLKVDLYPVNDVFDEFDKTLSIPSQWEGVLEK